MEKKYYIIPAIKVKEMEAETCQDMFARDQGICLGSGQIWIGENVDDSKLYVISISGLE